jgi:hypothetical protein
VIVSTWTPRVLMQRGLAYWWDASYARSLSVASNLQVTSWVDRVSGLTLTSRNTAAATDGPYYAARGLNGHPSIDFTESKHTVLASGASAASIGGDQITVFGVGMLRSSAGGSGYNRVTGFQYSSDANDYGSLDSVIPILSLNPSHAAEAIGSYRNNGAKAAGHTPVLYANAIWTARSTGGGGGVMEFRQNGDAASVESYGANFGATGRIAVGGQGWDTSIDVWDGYISEVLWFRRALTRLEQQRVEGYLSAKWGVPLNVNHPHAQRSLRTVNRRGSVLASPYTRILTPQSDVSNNGWVAG